MGYQVPSFPDLDSLITAGLPPKLRDNIDQIVLDFDESDVVKGLGSGSASTAKGATVIFKNDQVENIV